MESLEQHGEGRRWRWLGIAVIITVMAVCFGEETTVGSVQELRAKLFEHYDKLVRPVIYQNTTTIVYTGLTPLAITDLDEEKQIIELDSWIHMRWKDEYLVWNPEEYGGVTSFNIPSTEIWRPDITIYTGSPAKNIVIEVTTNAIVYNTGDVLWVPPVYIRSRCPQDGENIQDSRTCNIRIGSWTYNEYKVDIQLHRDDVELTYFSKSNPYWELISATAKRTSRHYSCCVEPYPSIDYNMTVRRRSTCRAFRKSCYGAQMNHHHSMFMP